MTEPVGPTPEPVDLNALSAEDVTVPQPEFPEPPPAETLRTSRLGGKRRSPRSRPPGDAAGPPPTMAVRVPKPRRGTFTQPVARLYTGAGIAVMPFDPVCANAIVSNAENIGRAWDNAAYSNDAVRKALTEFLKASVAAELIAAHIPLIVAITIHHSSRAQETLSKMGEGFAETVENNMRVGDMGNGIEEP